MVSAEGKKVYLERIRIIAIMLVVLNHIDINYYYYHNTQNAATFLISLLITVLCTMDVPLFFMVSGALLLEKNESVKDVYKKRILRFAICILIFSILQYVVKSFRGQITAPSLSDFVAKVMSGDIQETYWFLYEYLGILMILPLLRKMAQGMDDTEFIYLFWFRIIANILFSINMPQTSNVINGSWRESIQGVMSYSWYMLMGYYVEKRYKQEKDHVICSKLGFASGIILPVILVSVQYLFTGILNDGFTGMTTPFCTVLCFFVIKSKYVDNSDSRRNRFIILLGSLTFGIYLTEWYARGLLLPIYIYMTKHSIGIIASALYWLLSLVMALGFSFILKKIPFIKRII